MLRAERMLKETIQSLLQKPDYTHTNQFLRLNFEAMGDDSKSEMLRLGDEKTLKCIPC